MEYTGPFKDIFDKANNRFDGSRKEYLKKNESKRDNNLIKTLEDTLNEQFSIENIDQGIIKAEQYVTEILSVEAVIKEERAKNLEKTFVDSKDIAKSAANIFWSYIPDVIKKLKKNSTLGTEEINIYSKGLIGTYKKPDNSKNASYVISKFINFLDSAGKFYKQEEKTYVDEPSPKEYTSMSPVGINKKEITILEQIIKEGGISKKKLSKTSRIKKKDLPINELIEKGLINQVERSLFPTVNGLCSALNALNISKGFTCIANLYEMGGSYSGLVLDDSTIGNIQKKDIRALERLNLITNKLENEISNIKLQEHVIKAFEDYSK